MLKTSEFSRVHSTRENSDVFNSQDEIYLIFAEKKVNFLFLLYFLYTSCNVSPTEKVGAENAKTIFFWYQNIRHVLTKKMHTHT